MVDILDAIHDRQLRVPPDVLLPWFNWIRDLPPDAELDQRDDRLSQHLLPVLARILPRMVEPLVSERINATNPFAKRGAVEAHAVLHGVDRAYQVLTPKLWHRHPDGSVDYRFDSLTAPQQTYWICFKVDEQVCNGGFEQFFRNSSGLHSRQAPAALEEIGAPRRAGLMRQALEVIGPERVQAAERSAFDISEPQISGALGRLDSLYFDMRGEKDVLGLLKFYAAKHAEHFRE
jgi:hypothetical protein